MAGGFSSGFSSGFDIDVGSSAYVILFQQQVTDMLDIVKKGSTDRSVTIKIVDSTTGAPETAVEHNTSGIDLWYRREGAATTSITEAALTALTDAHSDGGIEHVGDGYYRLDLPDAAFATGANYVDVGGAVTGMIVIGGRVRLVDYDPEDASTLGLTGVATPTNITAGTITTATNLTNLPTIPANWLTAAGLATDAVTEIQSGLATSSSLARALTDITAIKKNAFVSTELAIGTVTSQTVLVLTGGPTNNIANVMVIIYDASDAAARVIAEGSYVGGTGTLTLTAATAITITTSDTVTLIAVAADTDAAAIRAAIGLASANLDTQLSTIDTVVDSILVDTGTTLQAELDGIQADTEDIQARLPAALVSGRIDASVGAMAANVLTATAIAADAITDAKVAADVTIASVTGAVGSVTGNVGGNVTGSVGSVVGGINTGTGVITTLDALDTAQDTQHGTTQTALANVIKTGEAFTASGPNDTNKVVTFTRN